MTVENFSICCWCWTFCFRSVTTSDYVIREKKKKRDTFVVVATEMDENSFLFHWSRSIPYIGAVWILNTPKSISYLFCFLLLNWWWIAKSYCSFAIIVCDECFTNMRHTHTHTLTRAFKCMQSKVIDTHHNLSIEWIYSAKKSRQNKNVSMIKWCWLLFSFDLTKWNATN